MTVHGAQRGLAAKTPLMIGHISSSRGGSRAGNIVRIRSIFFAKQSTLGNSSMLRNRWQMCFGSELFFSRKVRGPAVGERVPLSVNFCAVTNHQGCSVVTNHEK